MSANPHPKTRITLAEFNDLLKQRGHDRHIELINGEIVEKMPNEEHGYLVMELGFLLKTYFRQVGFGRVVTEVRIEVDEAGISQSRLPDVMVYIDNRRPIQTKAQLDILPDIAVEIQSPTNTRAQLIEKSEYYLANGVKEAWIIYPHVRMIEVMTSHHFALYEVGQTLESPDLLPGFKLDLAALFDYPREE